MSDNGLAFYELSEWTLTLHSGDIVTVFADSRGEDDGYHVFSIALAGRPIVLLPVARVPQVLVRGISMIVGRASQSDDSSDG
jgi:hypothetical protein